jgi:hypothetical protein
MLVAINVLLGLVFTGRELQYWMGERSAKKVLDAQRPGKPMHSSMRTDYQMRWIDLRSYDGVDPKKVETVLDDFFRLERLGFRFAPYVQYSYPPFKSATINIEDKDGFDFRRTIVTEPDHEFSGEVFLFGGSTAFGTHVADEWTVASYLQKLMAQHTPPLRVVNFGRPNYSWFQEMVLFQMLLHAGRRPRVAIFLDGVNFFDPRGAPMWSEKLERMWEETQLLPPSRFFPDWVPMFRLVNFITRNRRSQKYSQLMLDRKPALAPASYEPLGFLESYLRTQTVASRLGEAFGTRVLFFVQPNRAYRCDSGQYNTVLPNTYTTQVKTLYDLLREHKRTDYFFLGDLCKRFGIQNRAFVDDLHYNPAFGQYLAQAMYEIMAASL